MNKSTVSRGISPITAYSPKPSLLPKVKLTEYLEGLNTPQTPRKAKTHSVSPYLKKLSRAHKIRLSGQRYKPIFDAAKVVDEDLYAKTKFSPKNLSPRKKLVRTVYTKHRYTSANAMTRLVNFKQMPARMSLFEDQFTYRSSF